MDQKAKRLRTIVAKNIKTIAARRKVSVAILADLSGVSRAQLYDVVGQKKAATTDFLARFADANDIEPWRFLVPPNE